MNRSINLALIGASGVVGRKILKVLEKRDIQISTFYPLGFSTVGNEIQFKNSKYKILDVESFDLSKINIAIFSAGSGVAKKYAQTFVEKGIYVIDLSSEYRYVEDVPLVIPEININEIKKLEKPTLIANPNCSVSQLLLAIQPIHNELSINFINVATYQAVSGTGKEALAEFESQLSGNEDINVYPKRIAGNVIPQCDIFLENDFTKEEMKIAWETQKILDPNIPVQSTCVRVPVANGHSEAVFLRTENKTTKANIHELLMQTDGIKLIDDPSNNDYPTPYEHANDSEEVFVGRIRVEEINDENWISMWIVADNVYGKGAALNAVQILECLINENKI
jgi:aspartate-semialdehyde dehydrogenase